MDKFTLKSQEAMQEAQKLAERKGNQQIDAEHLLMALLHDTEGVAYQILKRIGVSMESIRKDIDELIDKFPKVIGATPVGQIDISPRLKKVLEIEDPLPPVRGDAFKLEQALINLIDNAVKYTEQGTITISIKHRDNRAMIEIKDTGIGIPEGHLSRIFERFYVVDKSRSKRLGGTGLGLSIVKHIVLIHNGAVDVKSSPSQGTTFLITLPTNSL